VQYLYLSYGVMVGIGAGLSFPPTVYIVTSYFVKLRGLANGLCISGSALGSIFLPPLLRVLLDEFGYRGACLIMGAITLNCFIAALFYDDVSKHMKKVKVEDNEDDDMQEEELQNMSTKRVLEDLQEEPEHYENGGKKAKFILTHDDCSTPVQTPTMDHKMDIFKFSMPNNSFDRSVSAVVVQNLANERHRERKISTPMKEDQRNSSFITQLNSTPSLAIENNNSSIRLNRLNSNRMSRSKGLKASPSTSSFQYISTPYHGEFLFLIDDLSFLIAQFHLIQALSRRFSPMNSHHTCRFVQLPVHSIPFNISKRTRRKLSRPAVATNTLTSRFYAILHILLS
jgi:hypothetical protein